MLIPGEGLTSLGGQLEGVGCIFLSFTEQCSAARCGDNLIAIEAKNTKVATGATGSILVCSAQRLGGILD